MNSRAFCAIAAACITSWSICANAKPYEHDGFQFRGIVGGGYLSNKETPMNDTLAGGAGGLELYFGGEVVPGLTLGGFFGGQMAVNPTFTYGGQSASTGDNVSLMLSLFGGYADYYFSPGSGFHIMLNVALASLELTVNNAQESIRGWSVGGGLGYDWWVAPEWSLGVLGKFNYGSESASGADESTYSPMLAFSFAFH